MSFLKRRWLFASVGLVVLLCVALGTFLAWRANQPVEPKTVYVMPEPNPERAEILKRALQPPKRAYATKVLNKAATTEDATVDNLDDSSGESSSQEDDFEEENLESVLAAIDEEDTKKGDFPPVPDGFPLVPIWLSVPGYQKGDSHDHEMVYRVLIKLWKEGERGFINGAFLPSHGKVYPLYPDVVYVRWVEDTIDNGDGNPFSIRYIKSTLGTEERVFAPSDFFSDDWKTRFPGLKYVDFDDGGYDPESFLADE
jgi:hypothetical protein